MKFFSSLGALVKSHPIHFLLFIVAVVLFLGGAVWFVLGKLFSLLKKVPGGATVENAVRAASSATGS